MASPLTSNAQARIKSKRITVYLAPDGTEHPTRNAARQRALEMDLENFLSLSTYIDKAVLTDVKEYLLAHAGEASKILARIAQLQRIQVTLGSKP